MKLIFSLLVVTLIQPSLQQNSFSFSQPIFATPSPVCVGGIVNISCRVTFNNLPVSASFTRNGSEVTENTENHEFLREAQFVVGVLVSNISLNDDNVQYICSTTGTSSDFMSSLRLNVSGPPIINRNFNVSNNCAPNATASWTVISDPICENVSYELTISPSDGIELLPPRGTRLPLSDKTLIITTDIVSHNLLELNDSLVYRATLNVSNNGGATDDEFSVQTEGPPTPLSFLTVIDSEICVTDSTLKWNDVNSSQACGNKSYVVTICCPNGTMNMDTTMETFYNFTGLTANNTCNVTVAGRNAAGVGDSGMRKIKTVTMDEGIPESVSNLAINKSTASSITVTWDVANSRYCGGVSFYQVNISSDEHTNIMNNSTKIMNNDDMLKANFTNLMENTIYTISIIAVNRAGNGMPSNITNMTLLGDCCDDDFCPIPCVFIVIACILILILMIDCCLFYYIYKKVKSGSEPHPINFITFVILTAGIGWVLYKHLTKTKGPTKIGMQDTAKTPSPDDEPVAYATTETDKVTFGTGGITYADIDIGKGPAAPGSIFPQDKPTYGQVKPSN